MSIPSLFAPHTLFFRLLEKFFDGMILERIFPTRFAIPMEFQWKWNIFDKYSA